MKERIVMEQKFFEAHVSSVEDLNYRLAEMNRQGYKVEAFEVLVSPMSDLRFLLLATKAEQEK